MEDTTSLEHLIVKRILAHSKLGSTAEQIAILTLSGEAVLFVPDGPCETKAVHVEFDLDPRDPHSVHVEKTKLN